LSRRWIARRRRWRLFFGDARFVPDDEEQAPQTSLS